MSGTFSRTRARGSQIAFLVRAFFSLSHFEFVEFLLLRNDSNSLSCKWPICPWNEKRTSSEDGKERPLKNLGLDDLHRYVVEKREKKTKLVNAGKTKSIHESS